jgi:hypothetical protein
MFRFDDQCTPLVNGLLDFFAQMKLRLARCGGSLAKPGDTVHAK